MKFDLGAAYGGQRWLERRRDRLLGEKPRRRCRRLLFRVQAQDGEYRMVIADHLVFLLIEEGGALAVYSEDDV